MEIVSIVANQVLIMFLLIAVGAVLSKTKMLSENGAKDISAILMYIVTPALMITAYQRDYDPAEAGGLLWCFGLSVITHLVAIGIGTLIFRKNERFYPNDRHCIARFGSIYSNAGFFSYPLLIAVFGPEGIFYGVGYTAIFTLFCWTHGVCLINGKFDRKQLGKLLLNPAIIGVLLAMLLYFTGWRLPERVNTVLGYLGDLNTPLAMIVLGTWVVKADWKRVFRDWTIFLTAGVRLIAIPLVMIGILLLLPVDDTVRIAALLPAAAPVGCNTAMIPALFGKDRFYGSQLVAVSTLLSIATMPCMVWLIQALTFGG